MTYYSTIAEAEQAIKDAGYSRNVSRAVWVHLFSGKTARVMRETPGKFYVQWS